MRYDFKLYSLGYAVSINSNIDLSNFFNTSLKLYAFIPNLNITGENEKIVANIKHYQSNNKKILYDKQNNTYLIKDNWLPEIPVYVIYLIFKIFNDGYMSRKNPFIVFHASAINKGNKDIAIVSHTGGGKTSIMLQLLDKYHFKMLSNNKTVFSCGKNKCKIVGGTRAISIRDSLLSKLKIKNIGKEKFIQRHILYLDEKYMGKFSDRESRKNIIIIPQLNDGYKKTIVVDKKEVLYYLFPMALELVNREVIFFNGNYVCPNNKISTTKKQQILNMLKILLSDSIIFQIHGTLKFICREINKIADK